MSVRGNTQTIGLVDLLGLIQASGHAGTLKVETGDQQNRLHFFGGQIYLPTGGSRGAYRIGALLVRAGKLSGKDLLRALQVQKTEGHRERLGDLLVRVKLVSREDLDQVIRAQFEEEICDLLFAEDADFELRKDVLPAGFADARGNIQALGFDTRSILMEASRRQDEWRRIHVAIPSARSIYRVAVLPSGAWHVDPKGKVSSEVADVDPDAKKAESVVLQRWRDAHAAFEQNPFDGIRSVEEIVAASGLPTFMAMGVVARLRQDGLIRELTAQEVEASAMSHLRAGRKKQAFKLYEWANESDRLRPSAVRLDKAFLRPEFAAGQAFSTRTSSVRALQILSRLLRRGAPFRFRAREAESSVEVFYGPTALRLHLVGPRRTHSTARYLRRRNALSADDLERARELAERTGRKLDRVLLEDGFVGREAWIRAVKDKIVSGLFSIFGWSEPHVEVQATADAPPPGPADVQGLVCEVPLTDALLESLRRDLLRWKVLLQEIPTPDVVFLCARATPEGQPRRAHDLFDGRRSVRDLISLARVAPLELLRFVYDCARTDRIRRLTDREHYERVEQSHRAGRLDDAIAMCKSAMAFGYAPKLYGERIKELRTLQQAQGKSVEARPVLQGDTSSMGLAELLQLLHQARSSGTLRIMDGEGEREKVLYLDQGTLHVLKVETSESDREVWDLIMGDETQTSLDLSGMLKRRGLVNETEVGAAELESIKQDIFDAFLWEGATFEYTQNLLPSELRQDTARATKLALRTDRLLFEAMSRVAEWDELKKVLRSEHAVLRYTSTEAQLGAVQRDGLGATAYLFDGKHSLIDVVRISGENRFKVYRLARDLVKERALVLDEVKRHPTTRVKKPPLASGRIPRLEPPSGRLVPGRKSASSGENETLVRPAARSGAGEADSRTLRRPPPSSVEQPAAREGSVRDGQSRDGPPLGSSSVRPRPRATSASRPRPEVLAETGEEIDPSLGDSIADDLDPV